MHTPPHRACSPRDEASYQRDLTCRRPVALVLLLVTACRGGAPAPAPLANDAGPPSKPAPAPLAGGVPLDGPYASLRELRQAHGFDDTEYSDTTVLGQASSPGGIEVSLREYADYPSAAHCAVTLSARQGLYVSSFFMCSWFRSGEDGATRDVSIEATTTAATIRFTMSYLRGDFMRDQAARDQPHQVSHHVITCSLDADRPTCTRPPTIVCYDPDGCP